MACLNVCVDIFPHFWKNFSHSLFKHSFLFPSGIPNRHVSHDFSYLIKPLSYFLSLSLPSYAAFWLTYFYLASSSLLLSQTVSNMLLNLFTVRNFSYLIFISKSSLQSIFFKSSWLFFIFFCSLHIVESLSLTSLITL